MSCRKKIDSKIWVDYWTMETEVRSLKQELTSTRDALKSATKRCRELVRELDSLHVCHESERNLRDQQLSKILRALLILESRLRQEQKSIRQQLCEKDTVIRNQQIEIAQLRRYTKNYLKNKRELDSYINSEDVTINKTSEATDNIRSSLNDSNVGKEIQQLKREIIIKLNCEDDQILKNKEFGVKKTDSFAGSDVSKESVTSENTDASIVTTTTEGSPSLLSTEGFCEGESSDLSPGSTLNKSSRRIISESDIQVTRSLRENAFNFKDSNRHQNDDDDDDDDDVDEDDDQVISQRRHGIIRSEPLEIYDNEVTKISRSDSKDDGMDCNFASDEDDEPIYVNACAGNDNKLKNNNVLSFREERGVANSDDNRLNNNNNNNISSNNNNEEKIEEEKCMEDTSGNWYSDPDEDRITEEVIQNNSYRPNSNHNSVLECVNQILLRDREEEENVRSIPRTFKHKGRIVRFQPARLSDIESVGSEMERKNSEEAIMDKESEVEADDEYGMRIISPNIMRITSSESNEEELDTTGAIPIAIIEPQVDIDAQSVISSVSSASPELSVMSKSSNRSSSPILRLERIEEKTCMSMSSKGLTIAKNLDYEDIESLPEIISPLPKTPPALPPKPQFRNNTLVLKKIPSPSFLIDETRKKHSGLSAPGYVRKIFGISTPSKSLSSSSKSLLFDNDHLNKSLTRSPGLNFINNNSFKEGIFRLPKKDKQKDLYRENQKIPRVPHMVRHFEEFKIGSDIESRCKKSKDRVSQFEIEEMDIRQNFEEFNLDECDLSDDPDRPEGDGSDRLGNLGLSKHQDDDIYCVVDNNNSSSSANSNSNANTNSNSSGIYDHFLEATGLSNKSILTPSRLLSNHKSVLKPKDIKYKNKIKAVCEKQIVNPLPAAGIKNNNHHHSNSNSNNNNNNNNNNNSHIHSHTLNRHWTGPFV